MGKLNGEFILKRLQPYLNEQREISEAEFAEAFGMLKLQEQYEVIQLMMAHDIELVCRKAPISGTQAYDKQTIPSIGKRPEDISLRNEQLCLMYQAGDQLAGEMLLIKNKPFIAKCAKKYGGRYRQNTLALEDLLQEGSIGLLTAAKKYDHSMGYALLTYAEHYIRQRIERSIMDNGFTIRLPVHVFEELRKISRLVNRLEGESELSGSMLKEVACELDVSVERVEWLLSVQENFLSTTSLNLTVGENRDSELLEFVPVETEQSLEEMVVDKIAFEELQRVMHRSLTSREGFVLAMRSGLRGGRSHTLEEIGQKIGVTRERVRQIEAKALKKLRAKVDFCKGDVCSGGLH